MLCGRALCADVAVEEEEEEEEYRGDDMLLLDLIDAWCVEGDRHDYDPREL
jgi:hypothetical protein